MGHPVSQRYGNKKPNQHKTYSTYTVSLFSLIKNLNIYRVQTLFLIICGEETLSLLLIARAKRKHDYKYD